GCAGKVAHDGMGNVETRRPIGRVLARQANGHTHRSQRTRLVQGKIGEVQGGETPVEVSAIRPWAISAGIGLRETMEIPPSGACAGLTLSAPNKPATDTTLVSNG